jgi:lipopolysaccharide assembly protein A
MRFLSWIVLALAAVLLVLFAVSNREAVAIELWPLPDRAELPLYLLVLGTLIVGFVVGEIVAWTGGWRWRREARRSRVRIAALERELASERSQRVSGSPVAALPQ